MKNVCKLAIPLLLWLTFSTIPSRAQNVLDPNDPLVTYDSLNPPAQPPFGQIGKWVRSFKRVTWNTTAYKAYIYKGVAFRLRYPKSYVPGVNDGKKYPMLVFFHGLGEAAPITDNEDQLFWGAEYFGQSVDNGTFDGYVLFMQSQGFWGGGHYDYIKEIIDYMVVNNKLDPFAVVANGLSAGGQGTWEMFLNHPTYIASAMPMDDVSIWYKDSATVNKVKYTPFWITHGALDGSPAPSTCEQVRDAMQAAGANYRNTMFQGVAHFSWPNAWNEPDFWPFVKRAYASNPWATGGKTQFCNGSAFSTTIGLARGYDGYQWRKDGVVIPGANTNTITVTQAGVYDAKVLRGTIWSDWSRIPVQITTVSCAPTPPPVIHMEAENVAAGNGLVFEPTTDMLGGTSDVTSQDKGDWESYNINVAAAGIYTLNFRVSSLNTNAQFQLQRPDSSVIATVNVPVTDGSQNFKTVTAQVTLPAGQQVIRIVTIRPGWNFNWWEIVGATNGNTVNQSPVVSAGTSQTIALPTNSVLLTGTASDPDGNIASYLWTQTSGPNAALISAPAQSSTNITNLVEGSYVFKLKVTDNQGASASANVSITVLPESSGLVGRIEAENYTAMSGIQTENTADAGSGLNVGWQENNDWMDYAVNIPTAGTYTLNFRVATPNTGVQFQVRNSGGTPLTTATVPNTSWWQTWQTFSVLVNLPAGPQTLRIFTTDAKGSGWNINWWEITTSTTTINQPPVVSAGPNQSVTLPVNTATLTGSATDTDGNIATYQWSQVSGPNTASINTPAAASITVNGLVQGSYVFRLRATDNQGASATADVTVTVFPEVTTTTQRIEAENYTAMSGIQTENTADAGGGLNVGWQENNDWMDYSVNLPSTGVYTLRFRVATPNTGVQFQLRNSNGTALTTVTVPNTSWWQTWQTYSVLVNLPAGAQTLRIYTTDAKGSGWNINWWEITPGSNITNQPPVVSAGTDQTVTLPVNIVSLNGSATDADGQIASYLWTQISGPANATFLNATATATTASGLQAGTYVFRLKATDNLGATATDDVTVTVNASNGNVLHIEAENYSAMSGIQTESTVDLGGGLDVGWQENGDWMDYNVDVPSTDTYTLRFRVATVNTGVKVQLRRSNGTIITTLTIPNTGWWQSWQTFTAQVNLHSGQQTIRIYTQDAKGSGWNLNWWEIVLPVPGAITMARTDIPEESQSAPVSLEVYPNPVRDNVKLTLDNELSGTMRLQIANMAGVIRRQVTITKPQRGFFQTSISLGDLPRGEYLLIMSQGNWREVRKLIKL